MEIDKTSGLRLHKGPQRDPYFYINKADITELSTCFYRDGCLEQQHECHHFHSVHPSRMHGIGGHVLEGQNQPVSSLWGGLKPNSIIYVSRPITILWGQNHAKIFIWVHCPRAPWRYVRGIAMLHENVTQN